MRKLLLRAVAALAVIGVASTASAAIVDVTYSGLVVRTDSGPNLDTYNLFGGGDLSYSTFSATFRMDTSRGGLVHSGGSDTLYGGTEQFPFTFQTPMDFAALTINGYTAQGGVERAASEGISQFGITNYARGVAGGHLEQFFLQADQLFPDLGPGFAFDQPFESLANIYGLYIVYDEINNPVELLSFFGYAQQDIRGVRGRVKVELVGGGVPEPSSWALMILGFGGAGAALRRRRPAVA